jgi:hypothetical protein
MESIIKALVDAFSTDKGISFIIVGLYVLFFNLLQLRSLFFPSLMIIALINVITSFGIAKISEGILFVRLYGFLGLQAIMTYLMPNINGLWILSVIGSFFSITRGNVLTYFPHACIIISLVLFALAFSTMIIPISTTFQTQGMRTGEELRLPKKYADSFYGHVFELIVNIILSAIVVLPYIFFKTYMTAYQESAYNIRTGIKIVFICLSLYTLTKANHMYADSIGFLDLPRFATTK